MSVNSRPDHRRFTRIRFTASAQLSAGGSIHAVELLDISLKGALLHVPADCPVPLGEETGLELKLADGVTIRMQCRVAHVEAGRIGLTCHHLDVDSATHLRRLIELNLGDESRLHRELAAMIDSP